jgi:hypothetical protein
MAHRLTASDRVKLRKIKSFKERATEFCRLQGYPSSMIWRAEMWLRIEARDEYLARKGVK